MSIIPDKTYYNVLKTGARIIIGSRLGNAEEYITDCLRGLDTYSVGFALLILCLQIGSVTSYERRYRAIANRMRDLIGNMMRPLWWERLDIADAIDDYRNIVKDLRDEYLSGLIATTSINP